MKVNPKSSILSNSVSHTDQKNNSTKKLFEDVFSVCLKKTHNNADEQENDLWNILAGEIKILSPLHSNIVEVKGKYASHNIIEAMVTAAINISESSDCRTHHKNHLMILSIPNWGNLKIQGRMSNGRVMLFIDSSNSVIEMISKNLSVINAVVSSRCNTLVQISIVRKPKQRDKFPINGKKYNEKNK